MTIIKSVADNQRHSAECHGSDLYPNGKVLVVIAAFGKQLSRLHRYPMLWMQTTVIGSSFLNGITGSRHKCSGIGSSVPAT